MPTAAEEATRQPATLAGAEPPPLAGSRVNHIRQRAEQGRSGRKQRGRAHRLAASWRQPLLTPSPYQSERPLGGSSCSDTLILFFSFK